MLEPTIPPPTMTTSAVCIRRIVWHGRGNSGNFPAIRDDVSIRGYVTDAAALQSGPATIDQGKLRALGRFFGTVSGGGGLMYTLELEVRGGEDVIGAGGKLGVRYQW